MQKTVLSKFDGKCNNLAQTTLEQGNYIGKKVNNDFVVLFLVADLLKAKVEPSSTAGAWSPMQEPTNANADKLLKAVSKPDLVILTSVLNTKNNTSDTIAVPEIFKTWAINREFYYQVNNKGRAKVNLNAVSKAGKKIDKTNQIPAESK